METNADGLKTEDEDMDNENNESVVDGNITDKQKEDVVDTTQNDDVTKAFTQDEVNEMIEKRLARERDKQSKEFQSLVKSERDKWQTEREEAEKIAIMGDDEKTQYEREQLQRQLEESQKEIAQLRSDQNRAALKEQATKVLSEKGIVADELTLKFVVADTADETQQNIKDFTKLVEDKSEAKRQDSLRGNTPRIGSGSSTIKYTLSQFMDLPSTEQAEFKRHNPTAYANIAAQI